MPEPPAEPVRVGELLGAAGRRLGLSHPVETGRLWERWPEIVGDALAAHVRPSSLRAGVLRVWAESPAWASEIGYLAEEIKRRVNGALGVELVAEVRPWTGPRPPAQGRVTPRSVTPARSRVRSALSDPQTALASARRAWARRFGGARGASREAPRNGENPC